MCYYLTWQKKNWRMLCLTEQSPNTPSMGQKRSSAAEKMSRKVQWHIDKSTFRKLNLENFFNSSKEPRVVRIWMGPCLQGNILKIISHPKFTDLKELWLTQNRLETIESLCNIQAPELKELWLRNNSICSIDPIRKCHLPKLTTISIYGNEIRDCSPITQMHIPNLSILWVQYQYKETVQGQNLCFLAKLETKNLNVLCIGALKRLSQQNFNKSFSRKFDLKQLKVYRKED